MARLLSATVFALCLLLAALPARSAPASEQAVQDKTLDQIKALQARAAGLTPAQRKIDTQLLDAMPNVAAAPGVSIRTVIPQDSSGQVEVDITANVSPALIEKITSLGGVVVYAFPESHAIRARLALGRLAEIAADPGVIAIKPAQYPKEQDVTAVEGDIAHQANVARALDGADGSGVKVCVISDTADTDEHDLERAFTSGALDRTHTHILPNQDGWKPPRTLPTEEWQDPGEGMAMMEIIHSLAPKAELEFATGRTGPGQMAANIRTLGSTSVGCNIIVDDEYYLYEPPFQDSEIGSAVNEVSGKGIYYFSSAGNYGSVLAKNASVWEGAFNGGGQFGGSSPTQPAGQLNLFASDTPYNAIEKPAEGTQSEVVYLFWNDPWLGRTNNYDLYVADSTGKIFAEGTARGLPDQSIDLQYYTAHKKLLVGDRIIVVKETGSADRVLRVDVTPRVTLKIGTHGRTKGHNASGAANAFGVGAIQVKKPPVPFAPADGVVAKFTSDGPRRIYFDENGAELTKDDLGADGGVLLNKPDFIAASGVHTTVPVPGLDFFSGTSAAAPHAAAIAALLLSRFKTITPSQMRDVLTKSALADGPGPWNDYAGAGILMANRAFEQAYQMFRPQLFVNRWQNFILLGGRIVDKRGSSIVNGGSRFAWVAAPPLTDVASVAIGEGKMDAVMKDGSVEEWTRADPPVPHKVANVSDVVSVAMCCGDKTIAVKADGTLIGWNGGTPPPGVNNVRSIYSNPGATMWGVIRHDGTVADWYEVNPVVHQSIPRLGPFVSAAAGEDFFMGLRNDGNVEMPDGDRSIFQPVRNNPGGVVALAASGWTAMALRGDGSLFVYSWRSALSPPPPANAKGLISISGANGDYFGLKADGSEIFLGHVLECSGGSCR